MKITLPKSQVQAVVSKFFFLAWKVSRVVGMGVLQDNPYASEMDVFKNIIGMKDYSDSSIIMGGNRGGNRTYADYVFGRMMKLGIKVIPNGDNFDLDVSDTAADPAYNSWASKYKSAAEVLSDALITCGVTAIPQIAETSKIE